LVAMADSMKGSCRTIIRPPDGCTPYQTEFEQQSIIFDQGESLFDLCSEHLHYQHSPKPSGLGMVSTSRTSAARMPFGATR
jgi:hypothetical protein